METKNTPLLFQQELNTFYKDILNCEITHPPYWAGRIPETFFLRKRKWIDAYKDWWGDEVLDYINFDWAEYAIIKNKNWTDEKIQVKKRLDNIDTSDVSNISNLSRTIKPWFWWFGESWALWSFKINSFDIRDDWHKMYIYTLTDYTLNWVTTKQMFVTDYTLTIKNNISSDYVQVWKTYRVQALDWLFESDDEISASLSSGGKSLFVFIKSKNKFYQIALETTFEFKSLYDVYEESTLDLSSITTVKDMEITPNTDKIIFVAWDTKVYSMAFPYNDITWATEIVEKDFEWTYAFNALWITYGWKRMYWASAGTIYQFDTQWDAYDISWFTYSEHSIAAWTTGYNDSVVLNVTNDWMNIMLAQVTWSNWYIAQVGFNHSKVIAEQRYNPNVNHSFKRNFQSAKGNLLYWGWANDKVTWEVTEAIYKLEASPTPSWSTNQFAGRYVMLWWWATSSTTWTSQWCAFPISANDGNKLTLWMWWDARPNETTYWIFESYWEVLVFVWWDWLYAIHNDDCVHRYESIAKDIAVVDADWSNWMMYCILSNWWIAMSASKTNDGNYPLGWWYMAWYMNGSSYIGSVSWALRVVPFNDIVVVFTKNWIYVIKKESMDYNSTTINTYTVDLAFWFLWIHSFNSVCSYNTGIYFLSNKKTFLSLNIEESYYNKYKITTEDLWIDIQQWLDWVKEDDPVAIEINTETIYITWYWWDKSTIFQYSTYYSFWHRRETALMIKNLTVDTNETYCWAITYRYWLSDVKLDEWQQEYTQHLRFFNWESDVFSLKTILYHELYLWVNTDMSTVAKYKARLSTWIYEYNIPLSNATFLQKSTNLTADPVLGKSILWYQTLWGNAEKYIIWTYLSDVDVLEIPLWLTYSLLEITIEWDFETGGNLLWTLVHEPHLTPYEDVVAYLDE